MKNNYQKFLLMIALSFITMFGVMYLHTYELDHIFFSTTRFYMVFLMISPMVVIMLTVMWGMYGNKKMNFLILGTSIVVFLVAFTFLRNQTFVQDEEYLKGMIPHHSIAILTSKKANITDPEVKRLAEEIIKTQEAEIAQMKRILERMTE